MYLHEANEDLAMSNPFEGHCFESSTRQDKTKMLCYSCLKRYCYEVKKEIIDTIFVFFKVLFYYFKTCLKTFPGKLENNMAIPIEYYCDSSLFQ